VLAVVALALTVLVARPCTRAQPLANQAAQAPGDDVAPSHGDRAVTARVDHPSLAGDHPRRTGMQITRSSLDTNPGPGDWFTGAVYIDTVATPSQPSRVGAAMVHFTPGARTAWHTHPFGQTIFVTEGVGLCQRRGGRIEVIRPGDRVFFEPGEEHWHGAAPNRFMTHLAIQEADDTGTPVTWGRHVTDDEYSAAPATDG
jgi:quercetin dioxygenase-like cupin family protein